MPAPERRFTVIGAEHAPASPWDSGGMAGPPSTGWYQARPVVTACRRARRALSSREVKRRSRGHSPGRHLSTRVDRIIQSTLAAACAVVIAVRPGLFRPPSECLFYLLSDNDTRRAQY